MIQRPWWLHLPPVSPLLRRRLLTAVPTFFLVVTLTFVIVRMAPGGPFRGERAVPEAVRENVEARYGLGRSLPVQYFQFWKNLLSAHLGPSFQQPERSAVSVLGQGAVPSVLLGLTAFLIALLLGLGGGTVAAINPRAAPAVSFGALLALALPVFVLGPLLVQILAVRLHVLPAGLWGSPSHLVLPALTLGIPVGGAMARFWRVVVSDALETPECYAARGRGLGEWGVVFRHAGPRSLPLLLNYVGPLAAGLVTGSVVVEKVFAIPGMGSFFVDSALARDYPVVIGATLLYAFVLLGIHTLVDLLHVRLDPRLNKEHADWMNAERARRAEEKAWQVAEAGDSKRQKAAHKAEVEKEKVAARKAAERAGGPKKGGEG